MDGDFSSGEVVRGGRKGERTVGLMRLPSRFGAGSLLPFDFCFGGRSFSLCHVASHLVDKLWLLLCICWWFPLHTQALPTSVLGLMARWGSPRTVPQGGTSQAVELSWGQAGAGAHQEQSH